MARRTLGRYRGPAFILANGNSFWIAEPSPLGARLVWSVMSRWVAVPDEPVEPRKVPLAVRRAAAGHFLRN